MIPFARNPEPNSENSTITHQYAVASHPLLSTRQTAFCLDPQVDTIRLARIQKICTKDMWNQIGQLPLFQSHSLLTRARVLEITPCGPFIAARARNGLCALFSLQTRQFICYLHHQPQEIVRSTFFNAFRNEIVKVSVSASDNFAALHCYAMDFDNLNVWSELFSDDEIAYPGFIEFDALNNRCLINEGKRKNYRLRSLTTYQLLYEKSNNGVFDIKMTPELLIIVHEPNGLAIPVTLIDKGQEQAISIPLIGNGDVEIVDRHELCFFVKQENQNLRIHNLASQTVRTIPNTGQCCVTDFIFLYPNGRLIVKYNGEFSMYTLQGKFVITLAAQRRLNPMPIAVGFKAQILLTTSQNQFEQWINVFSLVTGELLFESYIPPNVHNGYKISSIAYDERTGQIITGDGFGALTFWG
jgi:hypothetical protein